MKSRHRSIDFIEHYPLLNDLDSSVDLALANSIWPTPISKADFTTDVPHPKEPLRPTASSPTHFIRKDVRPFQIALVELENYHSINLSKLIKKINSLQN